jgi:hypothetical protein
MPRKPTGNPKASGPWIEDDAVRLTVRLPRALYTRLQAYAEGRRLAPYIREVLELYLDDKRQTSNTPSQAPEISRQTEIDPRVSADNKRQAIRILPAEETVAVETEEEIQQIINVPATAQDTTRQTEKNTQTRTALSWQTDQSHQGRDLVPGEAGEERRQIGESPSARRGGRRKPR